ncbi:cytidine deaminase [Companilactobacillus metriopterae]|uniref:cytidine deaminase n=1 Tax=Companilactobacillus metriopterae TaxID=1909267 RepID=UPI0019D6F63F
MNINEKELFDKAIKTMGNAYVPYSNYKVGAAIVCDDGNIYTGANVENASYGLTNCAERTAIFKAVSEGAKKVKAIIIVNKTDQMTKPCGACRQVMTEFMDADGQVFLSNNKNDFEEYRFDQIMPLVFDSKELN